jgi:hypothetical protein
MKMRARVAAAGVAGLVLGLATGLLLRGDGEPTPAPAPAARDVAAAAPPGLGALREELARERAAREALQADVDELRDAVLEWTALPPEAPGSEQADSALARDEEAARHDDSPWFDADALLETGLAAPEVERLRERFAEHELAELFLRDRAAREGWLQKPGYRQALREMREEFRADIGEEDYDRMLYAAGRQNRVRIVDVLPDSPAQRAGLAAGDVVVSYAGERMFEILPLTQATRGGNPGDPTEIRYVRNGEEQRVYVPRGPLGVRLGPGRLPPAP